MKKTLRQLFFILLVGNVAMAQDQPTDTAAPTQTKIRVFEPTKSVSGDNSYKWAVKTDLLSILVGEFPLIGEYRISKKMSVEASAALTYPYMTNSFSAFDEDDDIYGDVDAISGSSAEMGTAFRVAWKYFPSSDYDAIEGWYFGIQAMTKTMKRSYDNEDDYMVSGDDTKVKTGASIIIGKQLFMDSNVLWDFYFGVGIANTTHTFQTYDYNTEMSNEVEESKSKPNVQFGLRIGFGN